MNPSRAWRGVLAATALCAVGLAAAAAPPDAVEAPKPPLAPGVLPGVADPFAIPVDLTKRPDPDGFERAEAERRREARLKQWQERAMRGEQQFREASRFTANPEEDAGTFRFDLRLVQAVDSSRAKGKFTQYVNTRDGSVALFEPDLVIRALGGQPLPGVALHFVLLRPGSSALLCGRHKDFGDLCASADGLATPDFAVVQMLHALSGWLESVPRTPQILPVTPAAVRPDADAVAARGKFPNGQVVTVWREARASRIPTHVPWLGFGAGLYKDYDASRNRVAQVVVAEGADLNGGQIAFKLLELAPAERSFDTRPYGIVTAFGAKGLEDANRLGGELMAEGMRRAREIEEALRACPKGQAGKACRRQYRMEMDELNRSSREQALDWARRQGLPVDTAPR